MDTETKLEVFIAKVTEWMETTKQYRKELCVKNDIIRIELKENRDEVKVELKEIKESLSALPCGAREEITKNVKKDLDKIWMFITSIIIAIVGSWIGMIIKK